MTHKPQNERDNWTEAPKVRRAAAAEVEHVRGRRDLSGGGFQRQLAVPAKAANDKLRALRDSDRAGLVDRRARLDEMIFGSAPTSAADRMDVRQASTTAATVGDLDGAVAMMVQARRDHDEPLARAVARRAVDLSAGDPFGGRGLWEHVVEPWAAAHAGVPEKLAEMDDIGRELADPMARMQSDIQFGPVQVPELRGLNVDQLAQQADDLTDQRELTRIEEVGQRLSSDKIGPPA